jgi:hypothetical protein
MKFFLFISLFVALSSAQLPGTLTACIRKCLVSGIAAGPCTATLGVPAAACMCDMEDPGYEGFTGEWETCSMDCPDADQEAANAWMVVSLFALGISSSKIPTCLW